VAAAPLGLDFAAIALVDVFAAFLKDGGNFEVAFGSASSAEREASAVAVVAAADTGAAVLTAEALAADFAAVAFFFGGGTTFESPAAGRCRELSGKAPASGGSAGDDDFFAAGLITRGTAREEAMAFPEAFALADPSDGTPPFVAELGVEVFGGDRLVLMLAAFWARMAEIFSRSNFVRCSLAALSAAGSSGTRGGGMKWGGAGGMASSSLSSKSTTIGPGGNEAFGGIVDLIFGDKRALVFALFAMGCGRCRGCCCCCCCCRGCC